MKSHSFLANSTSWLKNFLKKFVENYFQANWEKMLTGCSEFSQIQILNVVVDESREPTAVSFAAEPFQIWRQIEQESMVGKEKTTSTFRDCHLSPTIYLPAKVNQPKWNRFCANLREIMPKNGEKQRESETHVAPIFEEICTRRISLCSDDAFDTSRTPQIWKQWCENGFIPKLFQ